MRQGDGYSKAFGDGSVRLSVGFGNDTRAAPRRDTGEKLSLCNKRRVSHLIETDGLLEYAEFCGNCYGTPRAPVEAHTENGRNVLLEIEIEGAKQVRKLCPEAVSIYILPPSMAELRRRLTDRGTETAEVIERRLSRAKEEIPYARECDYIVINDTVEKAAQICMPLWKHLRTAGRFLTIGLTHCCPNENLGGNDYA